MFTGEYAENVVVLLDQSVRVSHDMTILIAAKKKGNGFKAKVYLQDKNAEIVLTKPTVTDVTGRVLKEMCISNTRIKAQDCNSYLKGNH